MDYIGIDVIESSTESEWVAQCLEDLGHQVIVADPSFAPMYAQRSRKVKTDRRDARALCEACALGAYRPAHRSSEASRALRAQVAVREALAQTRTRHISLIRALLRQQGYRVRSGGAATFSECLGELELPEAFRAQVAPLLAARNNAAATSPRPATGACSHSWSRRRGNCCAVDAQTPKRFAHGLTGLRFDEASVSQRSPWRESLRASCLRCGAMAPTSDKPRLLHRMLHNPRSPRRPDTHVLPR